MLALLFSKVVLTVTWHAQERTVVYLVLPETKKRNHIMHLHLWLSQQLYAKFDQTAIYINVLLIKIQLDATVCSLIYFTAKSLYMFRVSTAPVIRSTKYCNRSLPSTSIQRGQVGTAVSTWPRWREVAEPILWPVPEVAVTGFSTPDDGCGGHPKHVEWLCSK